MKYPIKVFNFIKEYKNEVVIIKDFIIGKRITLLVGKNGSGKSTILRAIAGFIKYEGIVEVSGFEGMDLSSSAIANTRYTTFRSGPGGISVNSVTLASTISTVTNVLSALVL